MAARRVTSTERRQAINDEALLKQFEPVMRFTRGERFFPTHVETYLERCSLWVERPGSEPIRLVAEGDLTMEKLSEQRPSSFDAVQYLKFIEPLNLTEYTAYRVRQGLKRKDPKDVFHAGRGRLSRVGYGSRFVDALFSLALLARGRVPGDTAAAAAQTFEEILDKRERYKYFGRVLRQDGWTVLQYWFFYPFNNWRSGFFGANDHEADWEMLCIYLYEDQRGKLAPEWVAYASHDYVGDDLRRRWDDPELEKVDQHPVVYVGAGSHANYFAPGEYLTEVELPFLRVLVRLVDLWQAFWRRTLRRVQGDLDGNERSGFNIFRIPFVDYARGDGVSIGPQGEKEWGKPELIEPAPGWITDYRGLWGLYTRDLVAGEDAPAGPMYSRDGRVRPSWYDPLGWAGLNKVVPPNREIEASKQRLQEIEVRRSDAQKALKEKMRSLRQLGIEAQAMQGQSHLKGAYESHQEKIAALSEEIESMHAQIANDALLADTLKQHIDRLRSSHKGSPRAHLQRPHLPATRDAIQLSRFGEAWAAISIGLMMVGFVAIVLFARQYLLFGLISLITLIVVAEAGFRRRLSQLVTSVTISLAIVAGLVLLFEFFWEIVIAAVLLAGGYIIWENLRELWA